MFLDLQFWNCKFLLSPFFSLLLFCSSLWPHFFLTLQAPSAEAGGCYSPTGTWQQQSQNQQAAGLSSGSEAVCLSLLSSVHNSCLRLSQHADILPSLSHTQASFMTSELLKKALTSSLVASLVAQMVKNLLAMQETGLNSCVGKIPWRREWQPWRIPWTKEPSRLQSMGLQRVGHDWETNTSSLTLVSQCLQSAFCPFIS